MSQATVKRVVSVDRPGSRLTFFFNQENQLTVVYNRTANGGSELMARRLENLFTPEQLEPYQIFVSRLTERFDDTKKKIAYFHDLPEDPSSHFLNTDDIKQFSAFVFVSHHQLTRYLAVYPYLPRGKCFVIENAIEPITEYTRQNDFASGQPIKLIYTSTPHRGLNIVVPVFDYISKTENITLDVFSSFNLYGWGERDKQYQNLLNDCKNHPKINYHGTQSNEVVRKALAESHIFCLPSIWEETSCLCLIEAMSADNICVISSLGALPETSLGSQIMYDYTDYIHDHANIFYHSLLLGIQTAKKIDWNSKSASNCIIETKHGFDRFKGLWEQLFNRLNNNV
jgi:UDP-glucose:(glucosyl)LPS alpha-1,2-glucosyltransferase